MTTSAIYGTVSTAQHHTENQLLELRACAERNGWPVLEYLEGARARDRSRRPVLAQLLKDARAGKFQVILCWHMDPFGWSVKDFIKNVEVLNKAGVRFICVAHPIIDTDPRNPSSQMLTAILRVLAEFERDLFAQRVQMGVTRARQEQESATLLRIWGVESAWRSKSGKNMAHGAPRKIWHRGRAGELHAQGMSIRKIAAEVGSTYGSVRRALKGNGDADGYADRGVAKQGEGDLDSAIADVTQAIHLNPDDAQAYRGRALAKRAKNNLYGERVDLAKAVELEAAPK